MHDLVIRGGTIIDGTGQASFTGDVAVDDGVITEVGGKLGPGKRFEFNYDFCKGCGVCATECPCGAIDMVAESV